LRSNWRSFKKKQHTFLCRPYDKEFFLFQQENINLTTEEKNLHENVTLLSKKMRCTMGQPAAHLGRDRSIDWQNTAEICLSTMNAVANCTYLSMIIIFDNHE